MKLEELNLWKRHSITLGITNRIVGGVPTDPELIKGWISANMPEVVAEEQRKLAEKTLAELPKATEEKAEGMWTTFKRTDAGVYIEGRQVKALFKECANILREKLIQEERKGRKAEEKTTKSAFTALKAKLAERLFVEEHVVFIQRGGKNLPKPDGMEERAIHVDTAQGPRTALKRVDYIMAPASVKFTVRFLDDGVINLDLIKIILEFGGWNGLGADRSQGNGLFQVIEIQELESKTKK